MWKRRFPTAPPGATTNGAAVAKKTAQTGLMGVEHRKKGVVMKLTDNERQALKVLRELLSGKYQVLDFRLFGSKARGEGRPDSDLDVMIELPVNDPAIVADIDDIIYRINLDHDVFISAVIFGKDEIEEGPMSEAPIYKTIQREGVPI